MKLIELRGIFASVAILHCVQNDRELRIRNERGKRGAFLCFVEIAASRSRAPRNDTRAFALLAMTPCGQTNRV
ncbi:MAG: hypothetical protein LBL66_06500 [Clostridiales bacterium]|nr:hypothetical protein [Clostridiales bacterium]